MFGHAGGGTCGRADDDGQLTACGQLAPSGWLTRQPVGVDLGPLAGQQHGLITRQQALAAGWSQDRLDRHVREGRLVRRGPGVYAGAVPQDGVAAHAQLVRAWQLGKRGEWFAARRSAAVLLQLPLLGRSPALPQLVRDQLPRATRARDRHARVAPLPYDERVLVDGVPSTSPARTVVDLARAETPRSALIVADAALRRGLDPAELQRALDRQCRWPGVAKAREVLGLADGRAESPLESLTRWACLREQLPEVEPQVLLYRWDELVARLDLVLRGQLLVLEPDGAVKFDGPGVLPDLLARQEGIRDCGLDVVRVAWGDVAGDTRPFGDRIRRRLAEGSLRRLAPGVRLVASRVQPVGPLLPSYVGWPLAG